MKCSGKIRGLRADFTLNNDPQTLVTAEVGLVLPHEGDVLADNVEGMVTKQGIADSLGDVTELFTG